MVALALFFIVCIAYRISEAHGAPTSDGNNQSPADACALPAACYIECVQQPEKYTQASPRCKVGIVCPLPDINQLPHGCAPRMKRPYATATADFEAVCDPIPQCDYASPTPAANIYSPDPPPPTAVSGASLPTNKCQAQPSPPGLPDATSLSPLESQVAAYIAGLYSTDPMPSINTEQTIAQTYNTVDDYLYDTFPLPGGCFNRCLKCGAVRDGACIPDSCEEVCPPPA
ncbi:hypothetical protein GQ54DRAFT_297872 [Martensiomyces pterosporus]|nr:hypothetical protein GQ54DRAFT_297872 [Martensiomyces pterosporus]